jgi:hypothetical protein
MNPHVHAFDLHSSTGRLGPFNPDRNSHRPEVVATQSLGIQDIQDIQDINEPYQGFLGTDVKHPLAIQTASMKGSASA